VWVGGQERNKIAQNVQSNCILIGGK